VKKLIAYSSIVLANQKQLQDHSIRELDAFKFKKFWYLVSWVVKDKKRSIIGSKPLTTNKIK